MKKEQRDISLFPTRGQPSNAIFYPVSATRSLVLTALLIWGVVFMSQHIAAFASGKRIWSISKELPRSGPQRRNETLLGLASAGDCSDASISRSCSATAARNWMVSLLGCRLWTAAMRRPKFFVMFAC
jgi:hypothetical protein